MSQTDADNVRAFWTGGPVDIVGLFGPGAPTNPLADALDAETEIAFKPDNPGVEPPSLRGPQGLSEGWRDWLEPYESYLLEMEDFIDAGDAVYMPARVKARTKRDGVLIEHAPAAVCWLRDGKVVRLHFYLDRDEARADCGLDG